MNKTQLKYYVDLGLGSMFIVCFITGLMKWPTKVIGGMGQHWAGSLLHDFSGLFLGVFVFFHLLLNWDWIVCMTKKCIFR